MFEEVIMFVYQKNNDISINKYVLSRIQSRNIINGSHGKEINCLKSLQVDDTTIFISGGEDTTLRISTLDNDLQDKVKFKQLSSIRALKTLQMDKNQILLVSGGGRAQICVKIINFQTNNNEIIIKPEILTDFMIKGLDKNRKNNQDWRNHTIDFDPETRIMDLEILNDTKDPNNFVIYAGCSDAKLRIFKLLKKGKVKLELIDEIKHHTTCILKTKLINYLDDTILMTCTTRGYVAFWDIKNDSKTPFFEIKTNKSGINSIDTYIDEEHIVLATGGDDNSIQILALKYLNNYSMEVLDNLVLDKSHSSQITGLIFGNEYLLSTSIDQRVTVFKWSFVQKLKCDFVKQIYTDVADVKGMELVSKSSDSIKLCVYGKGIEVFQMELP